MRNIHVVSHTHWDREWYLPFQLFRLKLVHLVDGMLDILEQDQEFKYFMLDGQTIVLDDYLYMRPEKETILREHICSGRILIGPWHILPDMFLVGPEAHIRNLLEGDRTARKFGPKMMIGYMPDSFGHIGQIPQILRGFGIEAACLWRGVEDGPAEFWWQSPDGSSVLMAYLREGYGNAADLPADNLESFKLMIDQKANTLAQVSSTSDLLLMYGTDHMEPSLNTSEAIAYADEMLRDTHVLHSTLPQFVTALQASVKKQEVEIPAIAGELRSCKRMHLLPGVLSTRMWIKQRNHACETLLGKWVEPFSTLSTQISDENRPSTSIINPSPIIRQTWRLLMENHPHDSICGCSIDQVHDEMKVRFDQVEQIGKEITRQALETISGCINTNRSPEMTTTISLSSGHDLSALVVFNPSSTTRTDVISATIELPPNVTEFELVAENNISLPFQEHGQGSRDIINVTLDAGDFRSAFGNINDGRAAGMNIQDIKVQRASGKVSIDAIMANGGNPNLDMWKIRHKEILDYLADPSITTFHVRARSTSSTQITVTVPDVPGLGYRTLWVRTRPMVHKAPIRLSPILKMMMPLARFFLIKILAMRKNSNKPPFIIENNFLKVEAQKDGTLKILDKRTNNSYTGLNQFLDGGDCGDEYNFCPPTTDQMIAPRLNRASIVRGPIQQVLELELELTTPLTLAPDRRSRSPEQTTIAITTRITLTKNIPRVDINTSVSNCARNHRLRVHFPAPFASETSVQDGHFEVVERRIGLPDFDETWVEQPRPEVPQRAFSTITDGLCGLTIANRGLTEVEVMKNSAGNAEIAVTLMRCIGWLSRDDLTTRKGHAGPFLETPGAQLPGNWVFEYSIIPHTGGWQNGFAEAYAFESPLRLIPTGLHVGTLPATSSFLTIEPATFVVSSVKQSENGSGWILRGYNITSESIHVSIKLWKTFTKVIQINLAEEELSVLKPDKDGRITVPVGGKKILSVSFLN